MKNNIAIEITGFYRTIRVVVNICQVTDMYTVLFALLHDFNIQIVDIPPRYVTKANSRTTLDSIFNTVEDAFGVKISFQVFPLNDGPKFNTNFSSYEAAKEMSTLWENQFNTPYEISSKVE